MRIVRKLSEDEAREAAPALFAALESDEPLHYCLNCDGLRTHTTALCPYPDPHRQKERGRVISKLMLVPWFGPLPTWMPSYLTNIQRLTHHGYDFAFFHHTEGFRQRCRERLGVEAPIVAGGSKIHDYRATFGVLFADVIDGYDFWGHTDLDCVYGRIENWVTDDFLAGLDLHSNHDTYVCGPWSLYRNVPHVNELYEQVPDWRAILETPETTGWVETSFSRACETALGDRLAYTYWQTRNLNSFASCRWDGERLMEGDEEIAMLHFRRTKVYPEQLR